MIEDDVDIDGVRNELDLCDNSDTWFWEEVDQFGCTFSQLDTDADGGIDDDGDGVYDRFDECPNTTEGDSVNHDGCTVQAGD